MAGLRIPTLPKRGTSAMNDLSMADKLLFVSSILKGDRQAAMMIPALAQQRKQQAAQLAAQQDLAKMFDPAAGPEAGPEAPDAPVAQGPGVDGEPISEPAPAGPPRIPTFGAEFGSPTPARKIPMRSAGPSLRDPATMAKLLKAQAAGVDISGVLAMIKGVQPKRSVHSGKDGMYVFDEDEGKLTREAAYPDDPKVNFGWARGPDGKLIPEEGGPYDPDYIARVSGERRNAVVERPMPRTGGGRGSGIPAPPTGWRPAGR